MAADAQDQKSSQPGSGWTVPAEGLHVFPLRVYYEDTDAGGIVYYVNYLKFAERARTEMLRLLGGQQSRMMDEDGIVFVVKNCSLDYQAPARLDDALEVHTRLDEIGGASLRLRQELRRDGTLLADMRIRLAVLDARGKPARLPPRIRRNLEEAAQG